MQIWQLCRKFFGKWPKKFNSKSESNFEKVILSTKILLFKIFFCTGTLQFWRNCRKILVKVENSSVHFLKIFKDTNFFTWKNFSQNVALDAWNAVSTSLPNIFSQNSRNCFGQVIEIFKEWKQNFSEEIFFPKVSSGQVKNTFDQPGEKLRQNSETLLLKIRSYYEINECFHYFFNFSNCPLNT